MKQPDNSKNLSAQAWLECKETCEAYELMDLQGEPRGAWAKRRRERTSQLASDLDGSESEEDSTEQSSW